MPHQDPNRVASPLDGVVRSLIAGRLDHGSLLRMPDVTSRPFWVGAAIGAGLLLLLRSRLTGGGAADSAARPPEPPAPPV